MEELLDEKTLALARKVFASKGGRAGNGACKRRSAAHYRRIAAISVAKRQKKKKQKD